MRGGQSPKAERTFHLDQGLCAKLLWLNLIQPDIGSNFFDGNDKYFSKFLFLKYNCTNIRSFLIEFSSALAFF